MSGPWGDRWEWCVSLKHLIKPWGDGEVEGDFWNELCFCRHLLGRGCSGGMGRTSCKVLPISGSIQTHIHTHISPTYPTKHTSINSQMHTHTSTRNSTLFRWLVPFFTQTFHLSSSNSHTLVSWCWGLTPPSHGDCLLVASPHPLFQHSITPKFCLHSTRYVRTNRLPFTRKHPLVSVHPLRNG